MSDISIYDTEGTHVYPEWGPSEDSIGEAVDDLATMPPWPVVWFDGDTHRLYQRMTAVRQREEYSTRPNTFYVVVESADFERLDRAADELAMLFDDGWERPPGHDDPHTDPDTVRRIWRGGDREVSLPTGTVEALRQGDRLTWRAPDLATAYGVLRSLATADDGPTMAVTTKVESVEDVPVAIELSDREELSTFPETAERIDRAARASRERRAANACEALVESLHDLADRAREGPAEALGTIVLSGAVREAIQDVDVLDRVLGGDPAAAVPRDEAIERDRSAFANVDEDRLFALSERFEQSLLPSEEPPDAAGEPPGIDGSEANLRRTVLETHLEAIERYAEAVPEMEGDARLYGLEHLEVVRDAYLEPIEDPGFQPGSLPVIGRFVGSVPMPSPSEANEAVEESITATRRGILDDAFEDLDSQVMEFFEEWASFMDRDQAGLRRRYLETSTVFTGADLGGALVRPYRRWLLAALAILGITLLGVLSWVVLA